MKTNFSQKGFTLIELLVVISIIGLLSTIVLSSLNGARAKARDAQRLQALVQMRTALELYAQDHNGLYPMSKDEGGNDVTSIGTTLNCSGYATGGQIAIGLVPTYIAYIPQDPKPIGNANCYIYMSNGTDYKFLILDTVETIGGSSGTLNHPLRDSKTTSSVRTKSLAVWSRNQTSYSPSGNDPLNW